ncbi:uncharacterized protein LOC111899644 [Lactuca sativa]|uniref:uncharacterized protein LOC111899644 n=1 Tax=Lactuca sativa TaxID=4236 RepID=UPI000CD9793C|nr:uncharacterized protein LOC111899644 [Lactuca sativa]XP_023751263.1 uncharacterized protein LOC111899644 [Lactuca sativa]
MALIFDPVTIFTGMNCPKALSPIQKLNTNTSINNRKSHHVFKKICITRPKFLIGEDYGAKYAISVARGNHNGLNLNNEPFWLSPTKGFIRGIKSLFAFLAEQPSQLKYIEWPGFQNTLKTAMLTLVLVAMLIVGLSSVDSGLWYLLVTILRKPA